MLRNLIFFIGFIRKHHLFDSTMEHFSAPWLHYLLELLCWKKTGKELRENINYYTWIGPSSMPRIIIWCLNTHSVCLDSSRNIKYEQTGFQSAIYSKKVLWKGPTLLKAKSFELNYQSQPVFGRCRHLAELKLKFLNFLVFIELLLCRCYFRVYSDTESIFT